MNRKKIHVHIKGTKPILFDRFITMKNSEDIPVEEKFYIWPEGSGKLVYPTINIMSFLTADLTDSATKRIMGRKWKSTARALLSFIEFEKEFVPFIKKGKELTLSNSDWKIRKDVARVKKGGGLIVPSVKIRPILKEWELAWNMFFYENEEVKEPVLKNIFEKGGVMVGFGTYRGMFGKYEIIKWD